MFALIISLINFEVLLLPLMAKKLLPRFKESMKSEHGTQAIRKEINALETWHRKCFANKERVVGFRWKGLLKGKMGTYSTKLGLFNFNIRFLNLFGERSFTTCYLINRLPSSLLSIVTTSNKSFQNIWLYHLSMPIVLPEENLILQPLNVSL